MNAACPHKCMVHCMFLCVVEENQLSFSFQMAMGRVAIVMVVRMVRLVIVVRMVTVGGRTMKTIVVRNVKEPEVKKMASNGGKRKRHQVSHVCIVYEGSFN